MIRPALTPTDLLGTSYEVEGTAFQIIEADPTRVPGRWKVAGAGWYARRTPSGHERPALLVGPAETPESCLDLLLIYLTPPLPDRPRVLPPLEALRKSRTIRRYE